jgi:MFS family permease
MDSKQVIRSYMVIASLYTLSASLIWGVNTLFLLHAGLDIFGVFLANAVFTGAMVLFEIPTGVVADTSGRRTSFLLSTAVLCLGTLGYVGVSLLGGGLFWFCFMSIFLGLGFAFYSGAVEAWLVDALKATNYEGELEQVFARAGVITNGLMLIGTIAGGFLGSINLAFPYVVRAILLAMVCGWAYLNMREIGYTPRALNLAAIPKEMRKVARESITFGWQKMPVRLIMIVTFIQGLYFIWGFYATQPYFLELLGDPNAVWVSGVVTALVSISMMLGSWLLGRYMKRFRHRTTLLIAASLIITVSTIAVGLANSFWLAVPLFLIGTLATGILSPVKQGFLHQLIPSEQRATVISFNSMMDSAGGVIGQPTLGYIAERYNIASGFIVGGAATLLAIPFLWLLRKQGDSADHIKASDEVPSPVVPAAVVAEEA